MLKLNNISKYYSSNDVVALGLRKVNLELNLGEFIAVTGESGSGKSTLLNVISGLDTYEDGEMYINDEETSYFSVEDWESYRRQYIGFVFQNYNIIDSYSVYENVMIALKIQGYDKATRKERAIELIKKVGLESHLHHKASKLSGGQKQRAVIARALAKDCPIIVADEPTGNLDSESSDVILKLLKDISKDKLVIIVTHNYEEVEEYATRRIRLFDGEIVEDKKIRKSEEVEEQENVQSYFMNRLELITFSLRNLFRTPRRTIFQSIVFIFIVLIFTLTYGFFVMVTNSVGGSPYNSIFSNVTDSRIILTKDDKTFFTDTELTAINDINKVQYVYNHDVVNDSTKFIYEVHDEGDWVWVDSSGFYVNPAIALQSSDLIEGRMPESRNEIVVESNLGYSVGDIIPLADQEFYYYELGINDDSIVNTEDFTIVGITDTLRPFDYYGMLYFHLDYMNDGKVISDAYLKGWSPIYEINLNIEELNLNYYLNDVTFIVSDELAPGEIIASERMILDMEYYYHETNEDFMGELSDDFYEDFDLVFSSTSVFSSATNTVRISDYIPFDDVNNQTGDALKYGVTQNLYNYMIVSPEFYASLVSSDPYQITIYTHGRFDAQQVIEELKELGYSPIFPETVEDVDALGERITLTIVFGFLMIVLLVLVYFITYVVLKNIQQAKQKDFLIFRSIGASKNSLNKVTIIELLLLTGFAVVFVFLLLYLNRTFGWIRQIASLLSFFTLSNYAFLFFLLYLLSFLLGRRFNSRIFNKSVITSLKAE